MTSKAEMPCLFLPAWCPDALHAELPVVWADAGGAGERPLAAALDAARGTGFALVVPVERATLCAVALPAGSDYWQRQALAYAVEPFLLGEPDTMHLALGPALADGRHAVVAIERALLTGWLDFLRQAGATPAAVHVDADMLPTGHAAVWWDAQRCLLGGRPGTGLAFAPAQLPGVLALDEGIGDGYHAGATPPDPPATLRWHGVEASLHDWLRTGRARALDLMPPGFAPRSRLGRRTWSLAAAALALVFGLQLGFDGLRLWLLQQKADGYQQANAHIYRQLFPDEQRIVNLQAQLARHLADAGAGDALFELLGGLASAMPDDGSVQLQGVEYGRRGPGLEARLLFRQPDDQARLRAALDSAGLMVETADAAEAGATDPAISTLIISERS